MTDFNVIVPRLLVGGLVSTSADVEQLRAAGVTHSIGCCAEFKDDALKQAGGIEALWLGVADDGEPKPDSWFQQGLDFARRCYGQGPDTVLHVNCAAGVNRGPSMGYGILRGITHCSGAQAQAWFKAARPRALIAYASDADRFVRDLEGRPNPRPVPHPDEVELPADVPRHHEDHPLRGLVLGHDHYLTLTRGCRAPNDEAVGGIIIHRLATSPTGWCEGSIMFVDGYGPPTWSVESWSPLSCSPSFLCPCGDHGFIKGGAWQPA